MNKIYKVIWNKAKNRYSVVSEMAKSKGKVSSKSVGAAMLLSAMILGGTSAYAETTNTNVHYVSINTGANSETSNRNNDGAKAHGGVAIGGNANAYGKNGNAIGEKSLSIGELSSSFGAYSVAASEEGITKAKYDALSEEEKKNYVLHEINEHDGNSVEDVSLYYKVKFKEYTNEEFKKLGKAEMDRLKKEIGYGYFKGEDKWKVTPRALAMGYHARAIGKAATAIGNLAEATKYQATAVGVHSLASGEYSFAGGDQSKATNEGTVAIGHNTKASGQWSTALGSWAETKGQYATAVGVEAEGNYKNTTALGFRAKAKTAESVSVGAMSEVTGTNGTSIGYGATVTSMYGVAIGSNSKSDRERQMEGYLAEGDNSATWKAFLGAVSVGDEKEGYTRQITAVAAGTKDTDAVNVAQLKKLKEIVDKNKVTVEAKEGSQVTVTNEKQKDGSTKYVVDIAKDGTIGGDKDANLVTGDTVKNYVDGKLKDAGKNAAKPTTVVAGNNIKVEEVKNSDGGKEYTVSLSDEVKIGDVKIGKDGIDAGNKPISNVGDAVNKNDAVNLGQVNKIIGEKIKDNVKGTAGAAALAALHPLDFDPDDKFDVAVGASNYKGENALALGAFYRPNESTMISVGGTFGNGDRAVNAGVSVKIGQGNHVSNTRVAMAKDIIDMQKRMAEMEAQMSRMQSFIGELTGNATVEMFPDVEKNHWAYEYVEGLRKRGIIEGYPDGTFSGNRAMTRYEFAAMLYKALLKGEKLDARAVTEFAVELGRIRVDTIRKDKDGKPTIERVRINK